MVDRAETPPVPQVARSQRPPRVRERDTATDEEFQAAPRAKTGTTDVKIKITTITIINKILNIINKVTNAQVYQCTTLQMYKVTNAQGYKCTRLQMFLT